MGRGRRPATPGRRPATAGCGNAVSGPPRFETIPTYHISRMLLCIKFRSLLTFYSTLVGNARVSLHDCRGRFLGPRVYARRLQSRNEIDGSPGREGIVWKHTKPIRLEHGFFPRLLSGSHLLTGL